MPDDEKPPRDLAPVQKDSLAESPDEPPVVARLVIEIRSDGSRTIARGAMEDRLTGQSVSMKAEADSPLALTRQLVKVIMQTPLLAGGSGAVKKAASRLLYGRRGPPKSDT